MLYLMIGIYWVLIYIFRWWNSYSLSQFKTFSEYHRIQKIKGPENTEILYFAGNSSCYSEIADLMGEKNPPGITHQVGIATIGGNTPWIEPHDINQTSVSRYLLWPFYRLAFEWKGISGVPSYSNNIREINIGQEKDIQLALKQLQSFPLNKRVILYGRSRGTAVALGVLKRTDRDISGVILEAPFDDVEHVLDSQFHWIVACGVRILLRFTSYSPREISPLNLIRNRGCPILAIYSKADRVVHPECTQRLIQEMRRLEINVTEVILERSPHTGFAQTNLQDMITYHDAVEKFYFSID